MEKEILQTYTKEICPGVYLERYYTDTTKVYGNDPVEEKWTLRIDYCLAGRFEAEFTENRHSYIESGQFAINTTDYDSGGPEKTLHGLPRGAQKPIGRLGTALDLRDDGGQGALRRRGCALDRTFHGALGGGGRLPYVREGGRGRDDINARTQSWRQRRPRI